MIDQGTRGALEAMSRSGDQHGNYWISCAVVDEVGEGEWERRGEERRTAYIQYSVQYGSG
jgi:hypothetical protein